MDAALDTLLPWTARGASIILAALRGDQARDLPAGWLRTRDDRGSTRHYVAQIPEVLRLAFAGLSTIWGGASAGFRTPIDLLVWCQQPLARWPIDLKDSLFDLGDPIIDTAGCCLSDVGEELARHGKRRRDAELVDEAVFDVLRTIAAESPDTTVYEQLRRFLITHPVLTDPEFRRFRVDLPNGVADRAAGLLTLAYRSWPAPNSGQLAVCGRCRCPLPQGDGFPRCSTPWCAAIDGGRLEILELGGSRWYELRRGVRLYIAHPGLAELALADDLAQITGIQVDLWPGPPGRPDVYDLAVRFGKSETWAIDVKDHHQPFRLGDVTRIEDVMGNETRRFLAIPTWRMRRPDYRSRALDITRSNPVELIDTTSLVRIVKRHVTHFAGGARR